MLRTLAAWGSWVSMIASLLAFFGMFVALAAGWWAGSDGLLACLSLLAALYTGRLLRRLVTEVPPWKVYE